MALTNAEKQRRYREKLKNNPEKREEIRKKNLERIKSKTRKVQDMTEEEKNAKRKIWRKQKQNQKQKKVAEKTIETSDENKTQSKNPKFCLRLRKLNGCLKKSYSDIKKQNKTIQRLRKRIFRQKKQLEVDIEKRDKEILSLKCRNEVLESMIKAIYKESNTTEKRHIKKTALNKVKANKIISGCLGVVRVRKYKRIGHRKSQKISEEMAKFFVRDDISRITAGKKECRTRHKVKQQIRYLTDTLRNLYKIYKEEGGQQSFATFFKYKPFFVLSPTLQSRNTCLCIKHSNMSFLLNALISKQLLGRGTTLKDVLLRTTCDITSFDCMYGKCPICVNSATEFDANNDRKNEETVNWCCWESEKHTYTKKAKISGEAREMQTRKTVKNVKTGTLTELMQTFNKQIKLFKKHYFNMKTQQSQYQECLRHLKSHEVLILCDFSENFNCKLSEEIQAMHFGASKQQVTIHCVMVYWEDKCQSICTVSDSPCHEPSAIWAHLLPVIKFIRQKTPNTNVLHFYSDGPTSQYRQKKNYFMLNLFARKMNFNYATWSYTESGHGKGVADGIGGAVKRSLDRQVLYGHDIRNADDAYTNICAAMKAVKSFLIPIQEVENMKKVIPTNLRPLSGNNDVHQIITTKEENVVLHRPLSCFCGNKPGMCPCYLPKRHNLLPVIMEHTSTDDDTEMMTVLPKRHNLLPVIMEHTSTDDDTEMMTVLPKRHNLLPVIMEHTSTDDDIEMIILQDLQDVTEFPMITIDGGIITDEQPLPDEDIKMMTVILAGDQMDLSEDEHSEDDLPLAKLNSNAKPINDQLILSGPVGDKSPVISPDAISQSCSSREETVSDQLPVTLAGAISHNGDGEKLVSEKQPEAIAPKCEELVITSGVSHNYQLELAQVVEFSFQNCNDDNKTRSYVIGDHVIVRWGYSKYPGQIISKNPEGLMVRCMKKGMKFWRWPLIKDEELYSWENVLQKIDIPKFVKKGCFIVPELDY